MLFRTREEFLRKFLQPDLADLKIIKSYWDVEYNDFHNFFDIQIDRQTSWVYDVRKLIPAVDYFISGFPSWKLYYAGIGRLWVYPDCDEENDLDSLYKEVYDFPETSGYKNIHEFNNILRDTGIEAFASFAQDKKFHVYIKSEHSLEEIKLVMRTEDIVQADDSNIITYRNGVLVK